jgi:hypothetical protein
MGIPHRQLMGRMAVVAVLASLAQGCAWFAISNPLLPSARVVAQPIPSQLDVTYTFSRQQNVINTEFKEVAVEVSSYPRDGTPGVYFHSYSAEYFDLAGKSIPTVLLSKAHFGMSAYMPPASSDAPSKISLNLPIFNQQVRLYGSEQAFNFGGDITLNPNFSHTINARVTLYGEDDNFNQVQYSLNVPIRFIAHIQQ